MGTVTLELPDEVLQVLSSNGKDVTQEVRLALAFNLCSRGELATSLAARLAGLSYAEFLNAAAQRHVELFPVDFDELRRELQRPAPDDVMLERIKEDLARAQSGRS
jgi:predicted HTH domain antitoxin